jgi:hypothetical protein
MRSFETAEDQAHNALASQGKAYGRARSGSTGELNSMGQRLNSMHFHAVEGEVTLITTRPPVLGPHSRSQLKDLKLSPRPMTIPGAVKFGVHEGVERTWK